MALERRLFVFRDHSHHNILYVFGGLVKLLKSLEAAVHRSLPESLRVIDEAVDAYAYTRCCGADVPILCGYCGDHRFNFLKLYGERFED
ncbi:unnamed protein product [Sphenostylis stenocarpa]|uniref:Uncharacterized protein n=1 Tax=Sphenostylis stenocarpa TaxID=92480 RepID=A0AA86TF26_9FABA|nr:unnamed protein product [Sphenostylis stenocarpa]